LNEKKKQRKQREQERTEPLNRKIKNACSWEVIRKGLVTKVSAPGNTELAMGKCGVHRSRESRRNTKLPI
jgi:hypothetical protein